MTLHLKLPALVHQHVPPAQAGVFLATIFQIMCTYWQETDNMVLSQTVMLAQVVVKHLLGHLAKGLYKSRFLISGMTQRGKEKKRSPGDERRRGIVGSPGSPILSLAEHEELVSLLVTKTAPNRVSQPASLLSWVIAVAPEHGKDWGKARQPSPQVVDS